jgi:manganese/zinc/iron transport system permease protein
MPIPASILSPLSALTWYWSIDGWIIAAGVLCAVACALLGCFMVLRKMSMMGDALSHAVLPGLAAAFLITHSISPTVMLAGAVIVGVLTAVLTQAITRLGKVDEGASMGVVFTALFAVGLILIRVATDHRYVDLDPGCVLYGAIETAPSNTVALLGMHIPRVVLVLAVMCIVNLLFVTAFFKELRISSFDPELATTLGINANLMHYLLMTLVAMTTVASFEAVGSILVVAMLIVPAAAAHLLTDRLGSMLIVSALIAAACGILGHIAALLLPPALDFRDTSTAGMMAATAGGLFTLALLFAPRHGVLSKLAHRAALTLRITAEDILGALYRLEERYAPSPSSPSPGTPGEGRGEGSAHPPSLSFTDLSASLMTSRLTTLLALRRLRRRGRIAASPAGYHLTDSGRADARNLLRSHRLWETYFADQLQVRPDHTHRSAEHLEHITTPAMRRQLGQAAGSETDPQGKAIPREVVEQ